MSEDIGLLAEDKPQLLVTCYSFFGHQLSDASFDSSMSRSSSGEEYLFLIS
jgi:hypothetical protein